MATGCNSKSCDLCCHEPAAWVIGECDHLSCLACTARLRILCEQKECPVCRLKLDQVVVIDTPKPYSSIRTMGLRSDRKHGLLFEKPHLYDLYRTLRDHRCTRCPESPTFRLFSQLRDHHRRTHDLIYCDICVDNLKLFPSEFKLYTRQELTQHRREGDPDETSYRGHPICKFCDERFLDNDALHFHLRKLHFWCHFCESDGKQEFYENYPLLRQHFKVGHFLCVEGPCRHEKLTSVFRSKIDLQAHRASQHTKGLSKAEAKQLRQLDVGFTFSRGGAGEERGAGGERYGDDGFVQPRGRHGFSRGQRGRGAQIREREDPELASALSSSLRSSETQPPRSSPKMDKKPIKKPEGRKPEAIIVQSNNMDRPPPPIQQGFQLDGGGQNFQDTGKQKASRPPGFETINVPAIGVSAGSDGGESEWPDLTALTAGDKLLVHTSARQPAANIGDTVPPGFSSVTQMNKKGLNSSSRSRPNPQYQPLPTPNMGMGHDVTVPSNPPPGFAYGAPALPNQPAPVQDARNVKALESEVIARVRRALNYDKSKFTQFMTISGWYRNSEVTVHEYASQCYHLFGETWNEIGPQLAQVLPVKSKRRELMSLFSRAGTVSGLKSKKVSADPQSVWQKTRNGERVTSLNESDYPSLSAAAKQPDPSKAPQLWNTRVSAW